jgi:hypothetical protein
MPARDPFATTIRRTADPAKADKRTRSKWSRVMRYAAAYKLDSEPLDLFIKRKGGINACAARFTRGCQRWTEITPTPFSMAIEVPKGLERS